VLDHSSARSYPRRCVRGYGYKGSVTASAILTAAVALASLVLSACGAGERGRDAASVAQRFHAALGRDDGRAACMELSAAAASSLERQEKRPCQDAVLRLDLPGRAAAASSRVFLISASVHLAEGSATFLSEGSAGWKVSAAGCTPTAHDRPYDCELEG
jgi:predicted small secreted protein